MSPTEPKRPRDEEATSEPSMTQKFWPCAPDGFIPNSVIRKVLRPKTPPPRLIPQMTRFVPKELEPLPEIEPDWDEEEGTANEKIMWHCYA